MAAHCFTLARYVPLLTAIGYISTRHHATRDRGQRRVALVDDVDTLVPRGQLLEAAQSLASWNNVLGSTTVGEVVVDVVEVLRL